MQDPKNPKPRRKAPPDVPNMRPTPPPPVAPSHRNATVPSLPTQARVPDSAPSVVEICLPEITALLEAVAGADDDGYYKFCPGNDGKSWYLSYRWRWGQWAGHYVMSVVPRGDLRYGLTLLAEKVHAVRGKHLRPTKDRYGD